MKAYLSSGGIRQIGADQIYPRLTGYLEELNGGSK